MRKGSRTLSACRQLKLLQLTPPPPYSAAFSDGASSDSYCANQFNV